MSKRQRPVTASGKRPSSARGQRPGSAGGRCHSTTFALNHLIPIINNYNTIHVYYVKGITNEFNMCMSFAVLYKGINQFSVFQKIKLGIDKTD